MEGEGELAYPNIERPRNPFSVLRYLLDKSIVSFERLRREGLVDDEKALHSACKQQSEPEKGLRTTMMSMKRRASKR